MGQHALLGAGSGRGPGPLGATRGPLWPEDTVSWPSGPCLTYCWWRALDAWALTRSSSRADHSPSSLRRDAGQGARGERCGLQTQPPTLWGLSSEPPLTPWPSCSPLLTAQREARGRQGPSLAAHEDGGPASEATWPPAGGRSRGREERGVPVTSVPTAADTLCDPEFCHARGSPCIAHHEPGPEWTRLLTTWPASPLWPGCS